MKEEKEEVKASQSEKTSSSIKDAVQDDSTGNVREMQIVND